jgi:hypothetical protein
VIHFSSRIRAILNRKTTTSARNLLPDHHAQMTDSANSRRQSAKTTNVHVSRSASRRTAVTTNAAEHAVNANAARNVKAESAFLLHARVKNAVTTAVEPHAVTANAVKSALNFSAFSQRAPANNAGITAAMVSAEHANRISSCAAKYSSAKICAEI